MRVFVSSRMDEVREERTVAQSALLSGGHVPMMFETEPAWDELRRRLNEMMSLSGAFVGLYSVTLGNRGENILMLTPIEYELYYFTTGLLLSSIAKHAGWQANETVRDLQELAHLAGVPALGASELASKNTGLFRPYETMEQGQRLLLVRWREVLWRCMGAVEELEDGKDFVHGILRRRVVLLRRRAVSEWPISDRLFRVLEPWERAGCMRHFDRPDELHAILVSSFRPEDSPSKQVEKGVPKIYKMAVPCFPNTRGIVWAAANTAFRMGLNIESMWMEPPDGCPSCPTSTGSDGRGKRRDGTPSIAFRVADQYGGRTVRRDLLLDTYRNNVAPEGRALFGNGSSDAKGQTIRSAIMASELCESDLSVPRPGVPTKGAKDPCLETLNCIRKRADGLGQGEIVLMVCHRNVPGILAAVARAVAVLGWTITCGTMFPTWHPLLEFKESHLVYHRAREVQTMFLRLAQAKSGGPGGSRTVPVCRNASGADDRRSLLEFSVAYIMGVERAIVLERPTDRAG